MQARDPKTLTHEQLARIVTAVQELLWRDCDDDAPDVGIWDLDMDVNGGDFVDNVAEVLAGYGLAPVETQNGT